MNYVIVTSIEIWGSAGIGYGLGETDARLATDDSCNVLQFGSKAEAEAWIEANPVPHGTRCIDGRTTRLSGRRAVAINGRQPAWIDHALAFGGTRGTRRIAA